MATRKRTKARKASGGKTSARASKRAKVHATKKKGAPRRAAGAGASRVLAALQREKRALEKRLTDTVREIGQLRHHEARAAQLERQLKERDDTIAQLRHQLNDRRARDLSAADEDDDAIQPSLALGSRAAHDFDDDVAPDEEDDELI